MRTAVPNVNVLFPGSATATVGHLPPKLLENERAGENPLVAFFFGLTTDDADDFVATALCAVS
ncbi:MAG: hypothetical protein DME93_13430 [Verrucomicrobia bacterium]|nr:MAG: hypothetical protein DME93_13430 [Verrucomicrobiota bacterium]